MWKIFLSLFIGFLIGYKKIISDKMIKINSKVQTIFLVLLIFTMGLGIGMDSETLKQLPLIGGKALFFAVACSLGSIVVVYIISSIFFKKEM